MEENGTDPLGILTKPAVTTPAESDGGGDPLGILKKKDASVSPEYSVSSEQSPALAGLQKKLTDKSTESDIPKFETPEERKTYFLNQAAVKQMQLDKLKPEADKAIVDAFPADKLYAIPTKERAIQEAAIKKRDQAALIQKEIDDLKSQAYSDEEKLSGAQGTVDQIEAAKERTIAGAAGSYAGAFNKQVLETPGNILKGIGIGGAAIDRAVGVSDASATETATYQLGERWNKFVNDIAGPFVDKKYEKDFGTKLLGGLGSIVSMVAARNPAVAAEQLVAQGALKSIPQVAAQEALKLITSKSGVIAGSYAVDEYEAAKKKGLSEDQAFQVFLKNYLVNQTDALPIEAAFSKLNTLFNGSIAKKISAIGQGGLVEGAQEGIQQYLTNQIAKGSYDPQRDPLFGVLESVEVGGVLGMLLPTIGSAAQSASPEMRNKILDRASQIESKAIEMEKSKLNADPSTLVNQTRTNLTTTDVDQIAKASKQIEESINSGAYKFDKPIEENAIQEPSTAPVLQREQSETGVAGSGRERVEPVVQGEEVTQENKDTGEAQIAQKIEIPTGPESGTIEFKTETKPNTDDINQSTNAGQQTSESQQPSVQPDVSVERSTDDATTPRATDQPPPGNTDVAETGSTALDVSEKEKLSGIKKALVPLEKVESTDIERRSMDDMLKSAKEKVDSGEVNPKSIVDEISQGNGRALQPDEVSALVYYKTQMDNKSDEINSELVDAIDSGDTKKQATLRTQLDVLNKEIDAYHEMSVKTAYEQSLAFRMRQMLLDNEYNIQSQVNRYKAVNGGKIPAEVQQKFQELDKELKAANNKIRILEENASKDASSEAMQNIRKNLQRQREQRIERAKKQKEKINEFFESLKRKVDPNTLNSITEVIGTAVWNGSIDAVKMAVSAGADIASAIQSGIDYVKEHYRGNDFDEKLYSDTLRPSVETIIPEEPDIRMPEIVDGKLKIPASMLRSLVESGIDNISDVTDKIYSQIKDSIPGVSKRDIRDAITRYGETRTLSKENIDVKIREIKRVGRLISSLEDVQNKKRPLRSGLQRDKMTDQERSLQRQVKEGMKDIPLNKEEEANAWKNALDGVKSRLKNQIVDLENQIKTGEKTPKKKGIEYDTEAKQLQERRDELKKVITAIEGKPKMSDEQKIRQAVSATSKQIDELERKIKDKDTSKPTSSKTPVTEELSVLRAKRDELKKAYDAMENELGITDKRRIETYKKSIQKSISNYENRIKTGDFEKTKKPSPPSSDEITKLKLERDKIKQQFDLEQEKARLKNRPLNQKIWDGLMDAWNIPKSLIATLDFSAPFRQGAVLSVANPKAGLKAFGEMFRQAYSKTKADEWLLKLKETPEYALMKQSKLYLAEPTTRLSAKEEQFMSNLAEKIPVIGKLVGASNRAYTAYLNKIRSDVFMLGVEQMRQNGFTPENNPQEYKSWANFINNATGRGNLGGAEMAAPVLNGIFFAPRYVASRFNLLNPATYVKMPAPVRKMALKNVLGYIGTVAAIAILSDAAFGDDDDFDVEFDPRSSDFMKFRFGDTRYDAWAGFQQPVRLMAQLISGQRKSTKTGEISELSKDKFPNETRADVAINFIRSKIAPIPGTLWNFAEGENIVGEEVTPQGELYKNTVPLYLQDMASIFQEEGVTGLMAYIIPAAFGIGVQSYGGKSGLKNQDIDEGSEIQNLNKKRKYSISEPSKSNLTESLDHDVDDKMYDEYFKLRDEKIKNMFDRYKSRLERVEDNQIYDKLMDRIVKESDRHAKYKIARENKWRDVAENFAPGKPFEWHNYKKNEDGKVVQK